MPTVAGSEIEIYPLPLERYERMVDAGILGPDDRVELLRGVLAAVTPQGIPHARVVQWLNHTLAAGISPKVAGIRCQLPLRLPTVNSVPEPDVAIVEPEGPRDHHPGIAVLVIEVADSSAARDLQEKARIYAQAGLPEYWVVGVRDRAVSVHRLPSPDGYREIATASAGPLLAGDPRVPALDLDELFGDILRPGD